MSKAQKSIPAAEEKKKAAAKTKSVPGAAAKAKAPATREPAAKAKAPAVKKAAAKAQPAKKTPAKPAAKVPAKAPAKTAPAAAKSEKPSSAKTAKPAARVDAPEKTGKKPSAASSKTKSATRRVEKLSQSVTASPAGASAPAFSNGGLGIKASSKKPGLAIAPGVMILGKVAVGKPEVQEKVSERKLSKRELGDIKTILMEKRERLLVGMRRELAVQRERAESKAADEVDKATDAYDEDLSFEIATANDQELGEIQVALEKIDKGTYGECEICGCTISPSRLKILPSATTCVACRGQEEQARRRDDGNPLFSIMSGEDGESEGADIL